MNELQGDFICSKMGAGYYKCTLYYFSDLTQHGDTMSVIKGKERKFPAALVLLFAILFPVDRYYWALLSQWREDQATNIWLGYTQGLTHIPVGLMSSQGILNPNGMLIIGYFLSHLPNLIVTSLFLGCFQIIFIVLVAFSASSKNRGVFLFLLIPSLTSVILRSTSIELWNNYIFVSINLIFFLLVIKYLERPSLWFIPPIAALICIAPSLYLAGIVNAVTMTVLTLVMILYRRPAIKGITAVTAAVFGIIFISLMLTWIPYFNNINLQQILNFNETRMEPMSTAGTALKAVLEFPVYTASQWADRSSFDRATKYTDARIISPSTNFMLKLAAKAYLLQAIFAFFLFIYQLIQNMTSTKEIKPKPDRFVAEVVVLSALFIVISYMLSVLLGGSNWVNNERPDQIVQFLPMCLFVIFLLPFLFSTGGGTAKFISLFSHFSLILFGASNLICGFMIIHDHLTYRGRALTEADVTLLDKTRVVKFIAEDWHNYTDSNIVAVDYRLGGGVWNWVPEFGLSLTPWYPAPFTEGRVFDYSLKRQYGLINEQEGIQLRTFGTGRYLVTYAFQAPPMSENQTLVHYIIGRLRVSIVNK